MTLHVVEQILSILPPKDVMRFKCVSKKWYTVITNPRFIAMHLSNSMHNNLSITSTSCVVLKRLLHKVDTNTTNETNETNDEDEVVFSFLHFRNYNDYDHDDNDNDVDDEHSFLFSIQDINISCSTSLKTQPESFTLIGQCNGIICLAHSISGEVILCNPAIQEFKLLPSSPYPPDSNRHSSIDWFIEALGFGYDPNLNEYKLVNIGFTEPEYATTADELNIYFPTKVAVYTLGTDSWKEINNDSLETETTILWPEDFQMHFKEMCYWFGREQHNEMDVFEVDYKEFIRNVIIMFDTRDERFHDLMLPDIFYDPSKFIHSLHLLVWHQSVALFGAQTFLSSDEMHIGIWVMDEFGAWTKYKTFENIHSVYGKSLAFLKSNEIIMSDAHQRILSYNLDTKKPKYLPIQSTRTNSWPRKSTWTDDATVVYVNSIVSVLGVNKLKSRDNSTPDAGFSLYKYSSSPFSKSMVEKKSHSYSVWAFPSNDMSLIIKKVMEGLRAEFGGLEIEPHITVVGSIRMAHEAALNTFRSIQSHVFSPYQVKVNQVVTRNLYYQGVSLLIDQPDIDVSPELYFATGICGQEFRFCTSESKLSIKPNLHASTNSNLHAFYFSTLLHYPCEVLLETWDIRNYNLRLQAVIYIGVRPYLSLLYGYLTEEERKRAKEIVRILDESISNLSFPVTRLALYKIGYKDTTCTLKSWEKIAEYPLY